MSGPIIRKYGFPNFDQIFGKKEPQHGVENPTTPADPKAKSEPATEAQSKAEKSKES
jgi:hypothetical protein